ncbi:MAG: esterase, partial [Rubrivivax sp.]
MQVPIEWLPADGSAPQQLILLLHGWADESMGLAPLAQALRLQFPNAAVLVPESDTATDGGRRGRMWYSIEGMTPENWPQRVNAVLPMLETWVRVQQRRLGVGEAATAIGGFSQGAILALALALQHDGIAGRVLAFGGCLVTPPGQAPLQTTVHLFHGEDDTVIPAQGSRDALEQLGALQGDATLDIAGGVGHQLHPALIDCALHRLTHHIPARTWR